MSLYLINKSRKEIVSFNDCNLSTVFKSWKHTDNIHRDYEQAALNYYVDELGYMDLTCRCSIEYDSDTGTFHETTCGCTA